MVGNFQNWFPLHADVCLAIVYSMTNEEAGAWAKQLFADLVICNPNCKNEQAAKMIVERTEYREKKRKSGRIGASVRYGNADSESSTTIANEESAMAKDSTTNFCHSQDKTRQDIEDIRVGGAHTVEKKSSIPTIDEVLAHAVIVGMPEPEAREFFDFWTGAEWTNTRGAPLRNWKAALVSRKNDNANRRAEKKQNERQANRGRSASTKFRSESRPYDNDF